MRPLIKFLILMSAAHFYELRAEAFDADPVYRTVLEWELEAGRWKRVLSDENALNLIKHLADPETDSEILADSRTLELLGDHLKQDIGQYMENVDASLMKEDQETRIAYVENFRERLLDELMTDYEFRTKKKSLFSQYTLKFNESLKYDSNITQTPDDDTLVSEIDGLSNAGRFSLKRTFRSKKLNADIGITGGLGYNRYFDSDPKVSIRNAMNQNLAFSLGKKTPHIYTISYSFRNDMTQTTGRMKTTFSSHTLASQFTLKPIKSNSKLADLMIHIIKPELGFRDFTKVDNQKDSFIPALNYIFVTKKKHGERDDSGLIFTRLSHQDSNDPNQEYASGMINFAYTLGFKSYSVKPSLGLMFRWQDQYNAQKRNDTRINAGVEYSRKFKPGLTFKTSYTYSNQSSSINSLEFNNHSIMVSIGK